MEAIILNPQAQLLVDEINEQAKPSKTIDDIIAESLIPQGVEIPKPETVFELNGIPVFTKKSLSTLIGKAKSGKTTCTAYIMAQAINSKINVIWIDTEQGEYYGSRTQFWVLKIANLPSSKYLQYYDLKTENPAIRCQVLEQLIIKFSPDIVVIDGIRDLIFDINNSEESTLLTGLLMRLADDYNCHILSILHQNKGNEHARGHLGSEMINKSETVIKVTKDENNELTICEPEFTRGKLFESFAFERDENGIPIMVEYQNKLSNSDNNTKKVTPNDMDKTTHYKCLIKAFGEEKRMSYSDLVPALGASFEFFGASLGVIKIKNFIAYYTQNGFLTKPEKTGSKTFYEIKYDGNLTKIEPYEPLETDEDNPF